MHAWCSNKLVGLVSINHTLILNKFYWEKKQSKKNVVMKFNLFFQKIVRFIKIIRNVVLKLKWSALSAFGITRNYEMYTYQVDYKWVLWGLIYTHTHIWYITSWKSPRCYQANELLNFIYVIIYISTCVINITETSLECMHRLNCVYKCNSVSCLLKWLIILL